MHRYLKLKAEAVAPLRFLCNKVIALWYYKGMKITLQEFADKFRSIIGDETLSVPDDFIIQGVNWVFNSLPSIPHLERAFMEHRTENLNANGHYRWKIKSKFRRVADIDYLYFYTSTGGDPCPIKVCNRDNARFYRKNGLVELKASGVPCEYTLERKDDDTYLVLDRPSNIPLIIDYIVYGYPKPVSALTDTFEVSAVVENLMVSALRRLWYMETSDYTFAQTIENYLDNKEVVEAIQMLNKGYSAELPTVLGGF